MLLVTPNNSNQLEAQRAQEQQQQQQQKQADYEYDDYPAEESSCPAGRLDSRIQYQPPDCSRKARAGDKLRMHYVGKLIDGTKVGAARLDWHNPNTAREPPFLDLNLWSYTSDSGGASIHLVLIMRPLLLPIQPTSVV